MTAINLLEKVYNHSYNNFPESNGARIVRAIKDYKFSNGQPLNILKAVTILEALCEFKALGHCSTEEYKIVLANCSIMSGYSESELIDRMGNE